MARMVAGVGLVLVTVLSAGLAEARLPPSPFSIAVSPSSLEQGGRATVRIELKASPRSRRAEERYDLYLAWLFGGNFMRPDGTWSPEPIPFKAGVSLWDFHPIVLEWVDVNPPGWVSFTLLAVYPSSNPWSRSSWAFQPTLTWVRVNKSASREASLATVLTQGALVLATLVAAALVVAFPKNLSG